MHGVGTSPPGVARTGRRPGRRGTASAPPSPAVARTCAHDVTAVVRPEDADETLVTSIYHEHGRAMRAYAVRLRDNYIDDTAVDDLVQEALVRIWRHPEVLSNGKGSVRGWLFKTMRNIAGDWARARAVRPPEVRCPSNSDYSQYDQSARPALVPDPTDDVNAAIDAAAVVLPALDRLTPARRDAIERLYFRDQTPTQAAAELGDGVTAHAVKWSRS
jgi:RNA polymerase sigma-70 factor, ECF subfamily